MAQLTNTFSFDTYKASVMRLTNYPSSSMTGAVGTITDADENVMKEMFYAAAANLVLAGSRYAPRMTKDTEEIQNEDGTTTQQEKEQVTLTFTMPSNWDENAQSSAKYSMEDYVRNELTARWFSYTNREDVEKYQERAAAAMLSVRQKLNMKIKPIK